MCKILDPATVALPSARKEAKEEPEEIDVDAEETKGGKKGRRKALMATYEPGELSRHAFFYESTSMSAQTSESRAG